MDYLDVEFFEMLLSKSYQYYEKEHKMYPLMIDIMFLKSCYVLIRLLLE